MLSVYRVRPRDPNDDARSDEDFDDEELIVDESTLEEAMKSRVGGREQVDLGDGNNVHDIKELINGKTRHEENSRSAMDLAKKIWPQTDVRHCTESQSQDYDAKDVQAILTAAKASQQKGKAAGPILKDADIAPTLSVKYDATVEEVRAWYKMISKKTRRKQKTFECIPT